MQLISSLMPAIHTMTNTVNDATAELFQFHRGQDVFFMLMLVAFLMMFIRRYEWGVALATLLVFATSFPLYILAHTGIFGAAIDVELIIAAGFCAITLVIAIGVFLGHISTISYLLVGVLFVPSYVFIEWFLFSFLDGALDAGGSILVHMVAAYWGWGVILGLRNKAVNDEPADTSVHSVSFVWLASMLLLVLWPSFVTALLPPEDVVPGLVNTYMAMVASILVTYVLLWALKRTIDPLVFTYAILAGGVAIGASVDLATPLQSWIIGLVAGAVSTLSFLYLDEWLRNKTGVWDTMGVHNLHGVPGIVGGLTPIVLGFGAGTQAIAVVGTLVIALVLGLISGFILRLMPKPTKMLDDAEAFPAEEMRATDPA
jgi:ammonium transporter Rh